MACLKGKAMVKSRPGGRQYPGAPAGALLVPRHGGHGEGVRGDVPPVSGGGAGDEPGADEAHAPAGQAMAAPARRLQGPPRVEPERKQCSIHVIILPSLHIKVPICFRTHFTTTGVTHISLCISSAVWPS